jgi:UDP-hydrolysing UDP-N-acetyl-D-glucosamine 2-epimerase
MIGDGWSEQHALRPGPQPPPTVRRIAVVTGSRAEFGLLEPVMTAIGARSDQVLMVIAAGSHLVLPSQTFYDVRSKFNIAEVVPMQVSGKVGRAEDVESLAKGVARFGRAFEKLRPDFVVVLGDRIEALAAGLAASVGGYALCHIHGGDRAEGIADEAMRHALTKLAHVHFAATEESSNRILKMGEQPRRVFTVGSPALDSLPGFPVLGDEAFKELGAPEAIFLMHPTGRSNELEEAAAAAALEALGDTRVLLLHPNFDPGREGIIRALAGAHPQSVNRPHLPRETFVGLLKRLASTGGLLVGNSSAGLIEAAVLGVRVVDIGPRQNGRERCANVTHVDREYVAEIAAGVAKARLLTLHSATHPYGNGQSGQRIAEILSTIDPHEPGFLRKRCVY